MKKILLENIVRIVSAGISVFLLLVLFKDVDFLSVTESLASVGYVAILIPLFYFIGCVFDTLAWKQLFSSRSSSLSFSRLLGIHIAGESFYRFIPAGAVVGEAVKIFLTKKHFRLDFSHTFSSIVLRKLFMGIAQSLYIGCAVFAGLLFIESKPVGSIEVTGSIFAVALLVLFFFLGSWIVKGNLGSALHALLMKIPMVREKVSEKKKMFDETDTLLNRFLHEHKKNVALAILFFFFGWMTELSETIIILSALGIRIPVSDALLFEPVVSLLRSLAFIFPGGLGVMDAGYVSAFQSFGVHEAVVLSTAFIVIKRAKELVWIIIGVGLTVMLGGNITETFMKNIRPETAAEPV